MTTKWEGDDYQERFDRLAAEGIDVHGEAAFVMAYAPRSVLDAGCGTGRVAIEIARRGGALDGGIEVVGVDVDASMLATACTRAPGIAWIEHDLTTLDLGRTFQLVVMAGNVPLFTAPGTQRALISGCARHVATDGALVCGFQLGRGYELAALDNDCTDAGLSLDERFATWDRAPFRGGDYAVSVYRRTRRSG